MTNKHICPPKCQFEKCSKQDIEQVKLAEKFYQFTDGFRDSHVRNVDAAIADFWLKEISAIFLELEKEIKDLESKSTIEDEKYVYKICRNDVLFLIRTKREEIG